MQLAFLPPEMIPPISASCRQCSGDSLRATFYTPNSLLNAQIPDWGRVVKEYDTPIRHMLYSRVFRPELALMQRSHDSRPVQLVWQCFQLGARERSDGLWVSPVKDKGQLDNRMLGERNFVCLEANMFAAEGLFELIRRWPVKDSPCCSLAVSSLAPLLSNLSPARHPQTSQDSSPCCRGLLTCMPTSRPACSARRKTPCAGPAPDSRVWFLEIPQDMQPNFQSHSYPQTSHRAKTHRVAAPRQDYRFQHVKTLSQTCVLSFAAVPRPTAQAQRETMA